MIDIEALPHDLTKLHDISFFQSTEKLSDRALHALHQELEHAFRIGERGRRRNSKKGRFVDVRDTELQVLTSTRVRNGELRRIGHVYGNVEERLGCRLDFDERSLSPSSGVLAHSRGSDGGESGGVVAEVESETVGSQAAEERHGRGRKGRERMGTREGERGRGNREGHGDGHGDVKLCYIFGVWLLMAEAAGGFGEKVGGDLIERAENQIIARGRVYSLFHVSR